VVKLLLGHIPVRVVHKTRACASLLLAIA
jgi:hypothetical protein